MSDVNFTDTNVPQEPVLDPVTFDRLVDGELSDAERRAVLLALESHPDQWRQCALAFLEAQSWRPILRDVAARVGDGGEVQSLEEATNGRELSIPHQPYCEVSQPIAMANRRKSSAPVDVVRHAALAVSLLVAFGLGATISRIAFRVDTAPVGGTSIAKSHEQRIGSGPTGVVPPDTTDAGVNAIPGAATLASAGPSPNALPPLGKLVPDDIEQLLKQSGRRVYERQGFVPLRFDDGSRIHVPVREVEVVPMHFVTY